jgi:hypothetical protein
MLKYFVVVLLVVLIALCGCKKEQMEEQMVKPSIACQTVPASVGFMPIYEAGIMATAPAQSCEIANDAIRCVFQYEDASWRKTIYDYRAYDCEGKFKSSMSTGMSIVSPSDYISYPEKLVFGGMCSGIRSGDWDELPRWTSTEDRSKGGWANFGKCSPGPPAIPTPKLIEDRINVSVLQPWKCKTAGKKTRILCELQTSK